MEDHVILAVHLRNRENVAPDVQKVLTEFGCFIKTRVGMHTVQDGTCSPTGLIVLEICGGEENANKLLTALSAFEGVEVKKLVFTHD